jgi:hypothetical protein
VIVARNCILCILYALIVAAAVEHRPAVAGQLGLQETARGVFEIAHV